MIRLVNSDPFRPEINTMVDWLNDPENVRYSEQRHKKHSYDTQVDYFINGPDVFRMVYSDDDLVGTIAAYTDRNNSVADVGILIGKAYWGKGYGYEAWSTFCDQLLNNGIRKIEAGCMSGNQGMKRICRKYGMFTEGRRLGHFLISPEETATLLQWGKFNEAV